MAFTDSWWTVEPFGLTEADLGEFAEHYLLFRHPRSGRLYARPCDLLEYLRRALAERAALFDGKEVQRPQLRHKPWRARLVSLPVM